jgi:uncharacterized membrane protein YeaQ/YmgE (transglycosylase-associated protein family)
MSGETLLIILLVGLIAGWLAGQIVRGTGFGLIADIAIGIVGALIGSWLLPHLGIHLGSGIVPAIIGATIGAIVLLLILRLAYRRGRWCLAQAKNRVHFVKRKCHAQNSCQEKSCCPSRLDARRGQGTKEALKRQNAGEDRLQSAKAHAGGFETKGLCVGNFAGSSQQKEMSSAEFVAGWLQVQWDSDD